MQIDTTKQIYWRNLFHLIRYYLDIRCPAEPKPVSKYQEKNQESGCLLLALSSSENMTRGAVAQTYLAASILSDLFLSCLSCLPVEGEGWEDSASGSVCRAVGGAVWICCCSPIENNECQVFSRSATSQRNMNAT